jgi:hypothetical protein
MAETEVNAATTGSRDGEPFGRSVMERSSKGWGKWAANAAGIACIAGAGLAAMGCAIHTQSPIREIAYDFSDRDFYDRSYAPSPKYAEAEAAYTAPLRTPARAERFPGRIRPRDVDASTADGSSGERPAIILRPGTGAAAAPKPAAPAKPRSVAPAKPKGTK